ncbi:MAG: hypothetical protein LBF22_13605 [Deltaproteobacteria bacterium]|nr:hypothetical protein [Deltaproteobacteria bacterium]
MREQGENREIIVRGQGKCWKRAKKKSGKVKSLVKERGGEKKEKERIRQIKSCDF